VSFESRSQQRKVGGSSGSCCSARSAKAIEAHRVHAPSIAISAESVRQDSSVPINCLRSLDQSAGSAELAQQPLRLPAEAVSLETTSLERSRNKRSIVFFRISVAFPVVALNFQISHNPHGVKSLGRSLRVAGHVIALSA
jgi:hypothetical protein